MRYTPAFSFLFSFFLFSSICGAKTDAINLPDSTMDATLFQSASFIIPDSINIRGNKKTKDYIIERELTFTKGDTIFKHTYSEALAQSKRNLINTSLFLDVQIDFDITHTGACVCIISVTERWYTFPEPQFDLADRNFNVWWNEQHHDFARTEYGIDLLCYNFTGHNDLLEIKGISGFTKKAELFYTKPYITKHSDFGLGAFISWSSNKEINYSTENNKHLFFEADHYVRNKFRVGMQLTRRDKLFYYQSLELKYNQNQIADTIASLNPDYFLHGARVQKFFTATYTFTDNHVDNKSYPLTGHYAKAYIQKPGFGGGRLSEFENSVNQFILFGQYNQYLRLSGKLYAGAMLAGKLNFARDFPYNIHEGFGYCENFVRGYEYYVIDGQHTLLFRSNIKVNLFDIVFNNPVTNWAVFEKIPLAAYFKIFGDAGYVSDHTYDSNNFLSNRMQYSTGMGLDITTFYDWVFRLEYAVNAMGEFGLYLHLALDLNTYEDCNLW